MFPIINNLRLPGSVLKIATSQNLIVCADNFYNICAFKKDDGVVSYNHQISKSVENLHHYAKSVGIAQNSTRVAVGFPKNPKAVILDIQEKVSALATLTWQKLDVTNIVFSPENSYVITGGQDGRVIVYANSNFHLIVSLPPLSDYISCIAICKNENLLFSSCFSGTAVIFSIDKNIEIATFNKETVIESAFFYDNDSKVFCVCQNGEIFSYDLKNKQFLSSHCIKDSWLTVCVPLFNEDFALVGNKENKLYIIRLADCFILDTITMDNMGLVSAFIESNLLYLGWSDGSICVVDTHKSKEEILECINNDDLSGAFKIINEKNIFLKTLKEYVEKIESLWSKTLKEAIDLLAKDKFDEVSAITKPFMSDIRKKEELDYYWQQKETMASFLDAINATKYPDAYKLAEKHDYIRDSIAYANLEEKWEASFAKAKDLLLEGDLENISRAQDTLRPFAVVPCKKDSVMMLVRNADKYAIAEKTFKDKKLIEYFKMTERFPFLRETRIYKTAILAGDQVMQRINFFENERNFSKALEFCKILESIASFRAIAQKKTESIKAKQEFISLCNTRQLSKAFGVAESNHELQSLPECKNLYNEFKQKTKIAYDYAVMGSGKKVLDYLQDYIYIECWRDKIAGILKIAYLAEFINNAPGKENAIPNVSWKETFQYYVERYGKDEELKKIASENNLFDVLDSIPLDGNPKGYLTAIVADSLLSIDHQDLQEHHTDDNK